MTAPTIERYITRELLDQSLDFRVSDPGDFLPAVSRAEVTREPSLLLSCQFSAPPGPAPASRRDAMAIGSTLRAKPVRGNLGPWAVEIQGAFEWRESISGDRSVRVAAECNRVVLTASDKPPTYLVEWICNAKCPAGMYARATSQQLQRTLVRERDGRGAERIALELLPDASRGFSRDHLILDLSLGGRTVRARVGTSSIADDVFHRGFIEYEDGSVTADERLLVRAALSFAYGRQLVLLGVSTFDSEWRPIRLESERAKLLGAPADFRNASLTPTYLGTTFVEEEIVARIVNGFIAASEKGIDLEYPTWLLWLAREAPLDTSPAVLGSALEALRRSYLNLAGKGATTLLPAPVAKAIIDALKTTLSTIGATADQGKAADAEALRIFGNKISQLNDMSSSMQYPEFFTRLNLPLGDVERAALKERNLPAHGHRYGEGDYAALSTKVYALHSLANRVILKLCEADVTYTDYATIGHPELAMDQPLERQTG